jgi:hypothetical protein
MRATLPASTASSRRALFLLLAIALVLMTLLNMQQARVIKEQRAMIGVFARDSFNYLHLIARQRREAAAQPAKK